LLSQARCSQRRGENPSVDWAELVAPFRHTRRPIFTLQHEIVLPGRNKDPRSTAI
jgi:hypothetical protein